jgi:hypothetical protein
MGMEHVCSIFNMVGAMSRQAIMLTGLNEVNSMSNIININSVPS